MFDSMTLKIFNVFIFTVCGGLCQSTTEEQTSQCQHQYANLQSSLTKILSTIQSVQSQDEQSCRQRCLVELFSYGYDDVGGLHNNGTIKSNITINGHIVTRGRRGFTIVRIGDNCSAVETTQYDTFGSSSADASLSRYLEGLALHTRLAGITHDAFSWSLDKARSAFTALAVEVPPGDRSSLVFTAEKGRREYTQQSTKNRYKGPAIMKTVF